MRLEEYPTIPGMEAHAYVPQPAKPKSPLAVMNALKDLGHVSILIRTVDSGWFGAVGETVVQAKTPMKALEDAIAAAGVEL